MLSMDSSKSWLIVGASRGIGYEFVKQLLERGDRVIATVRNPTSKHTASHWSTKAGVDGARLTVLECDMLKESSIDRCVDMVKAIPSLNLNDVVLNAGVLKYPNRATEISYDDFAFHLHTNTIGPIICAQRLLKARIPIGTMVFMSSDSGSAQRFRPEEDGFGAYAASKCALNQMLRHMAAELQRKGDPTVILALHPGEVLTDMANVGLDWDVPGQMTAEESVAACIKTIETKGARDSGTFWTWENEPYPW